MRKIQLLLLAFSVALYARTCIIAYSAVKIPQYQKERFKSIFKDRAIIEKQRVYEVLKLGPFTSIDQSRSQLSYVKKFYKDAFIVNCQTPLPKRQYKRRPNTISAKALTPCRIDCKDLSCRECKEKKHPWEIDLVSLKKKTTLQVKPLLAFPKEYNTSESNQTERGCISSFMRFYINGSFRYLFSQAPLNAQRLKGDYENIKVGLQYGCFGNFWKFYTDDRIILSRRHKNSKTSTGLYLDIKELYLQSYGLFDNQMNFLLGRKYLYDTRSWWIDKPMDVVGVFNLHDLYSYEIYAGGRVNGYTVLSNDTSFAYDLKDTKFFLLHLDNQWRYNHHMGLFYLKEKSKGSRNISWLGLRFLGDEELKENRSIKYWLDLAINRNSESSDNGYALDIGTLYKKDPDWSLGLSFARSSKRFRQPIFSDNRSDFLQKYVRFRYYGEFLDPELSNISIFSLFAIHKPTLEKSFILALHDYQQNALTYPVYTTSFILPLNGKKKHIGSEIDFIYHYLLSLRYNYSFVISYFQGLGAFEDIASKRNGFYAKFNFTYYW